MAARRFAAVAEGEDAADLGKGESGFFTSRTSAEAWAEQHPEATGQIAGQAQAEEVGRHVFGPLLTGS
ncbi:organomercurial lyase [Streptomyces sp.]|uniref:organomercurial lyase n=1 Tax=Streptomyces sp. TaxID=1931 RepID=UPI0039C9BB0C